MRGYGDDTYGESFADVYDEWYEAISDVSATVDALGDLASRSGGRRVLELGVGTGRIAIPLAASGLEVHGVDTSAAMLDRLRAKPGGEHVQVTLGDMADAAPPGPFDVALIAYNTLFNLLDPARQEATLQACADRLAPRGAVVVEAFVPEDPPPAGEHVTVRTLDAGRVVLSVERHLPEKQVAEGQFVELTEANGVRLRPWSIRWARPAELDLMAARAGLELDERWSGFDRAPFDDDSDRHVSIYRLGAHGSAGNVVSSGAS